MKALASFTAMFVGWVVIAAAISIFLESLIDFFYERHKRKERKKYYKVDRHNES